MTADPARLERLGNQHGISHVTADYRELVARPDIDMVGIYSPDHLHMEHIEAAAAAGKHIICTKPMVVSLEQARRVVQVGAGQRREVPGRADQPLRAAVHGGA